MTLKENVMKTLLEDAFYSPIVKAQGATGGQTDFDVAETFAQGAVNDNPTETDATTLAGLAVGMIVNSWGY